MKARAASACAWSPWRLGLTLVAAAAAAMPVPQPLVERWYSDGAYPVIQRGLTGFSNLVPIALLDVSIIGVLVWLVWHGVRGWREARALRGRAWSVVSRALAFTVSVAAAVYLAFLCAWGFNYRRPPLTDRLRFDPGAVSPDAARELAERSVREVNALHPRANRRAWPGAFQVDATLEGAFHRVGRALGVARPFRLARPKPTILDPYFRRAAVAGMTNPFFLETLVATDLLPFERPFVVAHEWSHLAGLGDEGEANFLGFVAAAGGGEQARYSAWLFLYGQVTQSLTASERPAIALRLDPGPRADLRAIADRLERTVNPTIANAGWRVYDRYLRANQVEAGMESYVEVIRLLLGTRIVDAAGSADTLDGLGLPVPLK